MSSGGSQAVDAASAIRSRLASLEGTERVPGTLTKWADQGDNKYWEFVGNGETSTSDFVHTAALREAADGNQTVQPVAGNRAFSDVAARALLSAQDPSQPIPAGEVKELSLKDLVQLITPFLTAYASGQAQGGAGAGGGRAAGTSLSSDDERARIATGQVSSQGLALPLD